MPTFFFEQVVFEGICGASFQGDIAIDDITILNTGCLTLPAAAVPPTVPPTPPMPVNCTFESGLCNWRNLKSVDHFDWRRYRGRTYSSGTGPSFDHTTNSNRGNLEFERCRKKFLMSPFCFNTNPSDTSMQIAARCSVPTEGNLN